MSQCVSQCQKFLLAFVLLLVRLFFRIGTTIEIIINSLRDVTRLLVSLPVILHRRILHCKQSLFIFIQFGLLYILLRISFSRFISTLHFVPIRSSDCILNFAPILSIGDCRNIIPILTFCNGIPVWGCTHILGCTCILNHVPV